MVVPNELINEAKQRYGDKAIQEIIDYLKPDNYDEKNAKCSCPFGHIDKTPSMSWNTKNNHFHCFSCSRNFGILDLYLAQGDTFLNAVQKLFDKTGIKFAFGERGIKTKKDIIYPKYDKIDDRKEVENYLALRKISKATLDYCDVQQDKFNNIVFNYYDTNDVLGLVKYRPSRRIDKQKDKNKMWCQSGATAQHLLFNMNRVDTTRPLIVTEGEIDCLTLIECGIMNAVSIPLGATDEHWIEENWEWLEQFSKIIIWSDNDTAGLKMRKSVCNRLGSWKTFYVDLEVTHNGKLLKDANEVLYYKTKDDIINLVENAKEMPVENVIDLYDVEEFDLENSEGLSTGIKELDEKIYKMFFGTFNIITGVNSSGKSVLVNQISIAQPLHQNYDVFVFSAEMSTPMLKNWLELVLAGTENITMKNDHIHIIEKEARSKIRNWYKKRIWVYDNPSDYTADSILAKMEELARKYGVKVFLIDNLMMVNLNANNDNLYLKQKEFAVKLANFANKFNAIVNLVAHPRKVEDRKLTKMDISGSGDLTNLAHIVMGIHRYKPNEKLGVANPKTGEYFKGQEPIKHDCVVQMFKNRLTGTQDFEVPMWFDNPSYRFYSNTDELYFRYAWNKDTSPLPTYNPKDRGEDTPL